MKLCEKEDGEGRGGPLERGTAASSRAECTHAPPLMAEFMN